MKVVGDTVSHDNVCHNNKSKDCSKVKKLKKLKIRKYKTYYIVHWKAAA